MVFRSKPYSVNGVTDELLLYCDMIILLAFVCVLFGFSSHHPVFFLFQMSAQSALFKPIDDMIKSTFLPKMPI